MRGVGSQSPAILLRRLWLSSQSEPNSTGKRSSALIGLCSPRSCNTGGYKSKLPSVSLRKGLTRSVALTKRQPSCADPMPKSIAHEETPPSFDSGVSQFLARPGLESWTCKPGGHFKSSVLHHDWKDRAARPIDLQSIYPHPVHPSEDRPCLARLRFFALAWQPIIEETRPMARQWCGRRRGSPIDCHRQNVRL